MDRAQAIANIEAYFDDGRFKTDLARRVAMPTESQNPDRKADLAHYLRDEMIPSLAALGFSCRIFEQAGVPGPFLYAERVEDAKLPTVLGYGHGDVIRGLDAKWREGLSPWQLIERDGRYWGRGTADNKGQHTINLAALAAVIATRSRLGFNAKWLIEMGEETGSRGLREVCRDNKALFAADVFIASDGPRLSAERPTIFLGSRGCMSIDLWIDAREGGHHSGNWGGLLSSPAIQLAHALTTVVDEKGRILVPELRPKHIPNSVRAALADCKIESAPGDPETDPDWSEPGLSPAEKLFAWSAFEILAMTSGVPESPVNAIPPRAWARTQMRFVAGMDPNGFVPALRRHLDKSGFKMVQVAPAGDEVMHATRLDPDHPWVRWTSASMARTTGRPPAVVPNFGGSLPNDIFSDLLDLPTVWIPHSYPGCSQHAPDEHLPCALARDALRIMAGVYWDLGEPGTPGSAA
ncbi:MAG: M20 family metallopeptidase [Alphaproteobacteria bacterium]|nr:M20 family metallopeptidase [Alphaproteobacteria bacterium]